MQIKTQCKHQKSLQCWWITRWAVSDSQCGRSKDKLQLSCMLICDVQCLFLSAEFAFFIWKSRVFIVKLINDSLWSFVRSLHSDSTSVHAWNDRKEYARRNEKNMSIRCFLVPQCMKLHSEMMMFVKIKFIGKLHEMRCNADSHVSFNIFHFPHPLKQNCTLCIVCKYLSFAASEHQVNIPLCSHNDQQRVPNRLFIFFINCEVEFYICNFELIKSMNKITKLTSLFSSLQCFLSPGSKLINTDINLVDVKSSDSKSFSSLYAISICIRNC